MQLSLLDYTLTPEESTPPPKVTIANPLAVGQCVKIIRVDTLSASLVGQVGTVEAMIAADIIQVRTDEGLWTIETSQVEEATAPTISAWQQAKIDHCRRMIARLSLNRYASVVWELEQTLETILKEVTG